MSLLASVGVGATLGSTLHHAHESPIVDEALLGAARELLLLLSLCDFGCLILHFTRARQTSVHLSHVGRPPGDLPVMFGPK